MRLTIKIDTGAPGVRLDKSGGSTFEDVIDDVDKEWIASVLVGLSKDFPYSRGRSGKVRGRNGGVAGTWRITSPGKGSDGMKTIVSYANRWIRAKKSGVELVDFLEEEGVTPSTHRTRLRRLNACYNGRFPV